MQFLTLISSETKLAILVFVIFPAIAVLLLRKLLYQHLKKMNDSIARLAFSGGEGEKQLSIVKKLKARYKEASKKLEHVNTIALIYSVYKDETIAYLGMKIQFDRVEAITKVLPNLLIAFGLIGTFLGITNNLNNISTTITSFSQNDSDLLGLVQGLKRPLQDMGVAFSTSLFGILFGSILTIANTLWNTSIAKYNLLAGLEDYLDNTYKPEVEGNTRLDRAIEKMVKQQEEFLLRFHENVGQVLEASFGKAAMQITNECSRINKIAEGVYTSFSNAAGTISTGATTFEQVANSLTEHNQTLANSLQEFKGGVEIFKIAANQIEQNNIVKNLDRILGELNTSQTAFTNSTQILESSLVGITSSNQAAAVLAEKVYQSLHTSVTYIDSASVAIDRGATIFSQAAISLEAQTQTISSLVPQFKSGIDSFKLGADKIENNSIIQNLDRVLTSLNTHEQAFTKSAQSFGSSIVSITDSNQKAAQLAQQVYQSWQNHTEKFDAASVTISTSATTFENAANTIQGQTQTLTGLIPHLKTGVKSFVVAANKVNKNNIIQNLDMVVANLSNTQQAFTESTQALSIGVQDIVSNNQQVTQLAKQVYDGLEMSTDSIQAGAKRFVDAAQLIHDSLLAIDLNNATETWQTAQSEFAKSTIVFSRATEKIQPTIVSIDRAVDSLQQFSGEVVTLSQNTIKMSESTQTAVVTIDRNHQQILDSTQSNIQKIGEMNNSNWQELKTIFAKQQLQSL